MGSARGIVHGVGINDADYIVMPTVNGSQVRCPFYAKWASMIKRCYSLPYIKANPTYIGCTVCEEWLTFSNFKAWMEMQDWKDKELDKDILVKGNKIYSPETCVFIDHMTNGFTNECGASRGKWPLGVVFCQRKRRFRAGSSDPINKATRKWLGYFDTPEQAHEAWRKRKHELACQLADLQTDERVASALRSRYLLK
jgi:hypothetical protein